MLKPVSRLIYSTSFSIKPSLLKNTKPSVFLISKRSFSSLGPVTTSIPKKKSLFNKWILGSAVTAIGIGILTYFKKEKANQLGNVIQIGDMQLLSNGVLLPGHFDISKINDDMKKYDLCETLKKELSEVFMNPDFNEIKKFINKKGTLFMIPMIDPNPWTSNLMTIYETALTSTKRRWSEEELLFIFNYYLQNSEEAHVTKINLLHLLVRTQLSISDDLRIKIIKNAIEKNPELLKQRLVLNEGLDMTPAEMAIRTSYNKALMHYLLGETTKHIGHFSEEEKKKLISHASWLLRSGMQCNVSLGKHMIKIIKELP